MNRFIDYSGLSWDEFRKMVNTDTPKEGLAPMELLYWSREHQQMQEIASCDNEHFSGIWVNHPPSVPDGFFNYTQNGGAEDFARRWESQTKNNHKS